MEVILQQDFPALGYVGDSVKVKSGYARNYLIPRGIAIESLSANARLLKHRMSGIQAKRARLRKEAEALSAKLVAEVQLQFTLKSGEKGKSFGSITVKDVEAVIKSAGFTIDRRQIRIPDMIRKAGDFSVLVKLHSEVVATLPLKVIVEAPPQREESKKRGAKNSRKAAAESEAEGSEDSSEVEKVDDEGGESTEPKKRKGGARSKKAASAEDSVEQ